MADSTPSNFTIMTNAGLDLATQLLGSKNRITAFRAVATDTAYYTADPETIAGLTAITPIKQEGIINDVHDESANTSVITAAFNQKEIDSDYQLNTLGIFATDENKNEILYAVMCLQHPDYMAKVDTNDVMTYQTKIVVGNSQNVQISLAAADTVTMAQFNAQIAKMIDTDKLKKYLTDNKIATEAYVNDQVKAIKPAAGTMTLSDDNVSVKATTKDGEQTGVFVTQETLDKLADKTEVVKKSPDTGEVTEQVNFGTTNPINHAGDMYLGAHQSADEDTAVAAAKAATMPGWYWFPEE